MTIDELWDAIVRAGHEHDYVLNSAPRAPGSGLPSSVTVVEPAADAAGRWVVYFTEHGEVGKQRYFATESAACRHILTQVTAPPSPIHVLTDAEREQAETIADNEVEHRRQVIRDAGYDPDTRQPLPPADR